jgi:hypothetical protein
VTYLRGKPMLIGRCMGCGADVRWYAKAWRDTPRSGRKVGPQHVCVLCGAFMPKAGSRCARLRGHAWEHRSIYAMTNARRKGLVA